MKIHTRLARPLASVAFVVMSALAAQACFVRGGIPAPMYALGALGFSQMPFNGGAYYGGGIYNHQYSPPGYYNNMAPMFQQPTAAQRAQIQAVTGNLPVPPGPTPPFGFRNGDGAPVGPSQCWREGCVVY